MSELHSILNNTLLITQFIAALIGVIYLNQLKNSYWKWFSIYLIIIFIQECFWKYYTSIDRDGKFVYYAYIGVTIEYLFFYWLYAYKSQKKKKLFQISVLLYVITIGVLTLLRNVYEVHSLSINIGSIILIVLIILEFIKQTKTDNILNFRENKMFYINIGLILFYIGSYPFHVFGKELYENYNDIWNIYNAYFLTTNSIMYLLFSASFIWGKTR